MPNFKVIIPEGKTLDDQVASIVGEEGLAVVVRLADQLHGALYTQSCRISHFQAQLTGVALRRKGENPQDQEQPTLHDRSCAPTDWLFRWEQKMLCCLPHADWLVQGLVPSKKPAHNLPNSLPDARLIDLRRKG